MSKASYMNLKMSETAYVIVHGFAGGLYEIEYLQQFLVSHNKTVYPILLAGHGLTKKELKKSTHTDWLESAKAKFAEITKHHKEIILIGFSLGGLICTNLANLYPVKNLVLVNTPVHLWNFPVVFNLIFNDLKHKQRDNIKFIKKSIFATPIITGIHFLQILFKTKKLFKNITCPTLILQCEKDETVGAKSAEFIKSQIKDSVLKYYAGGCHVVFCDEKSNRDEICEDIFKFYLFN